MRSKQAELSGKTVVVTRARHQARELIALFEARGASVIALPVIEVVPVEPLDLSVYADCEAVIFGSKNAAELSFDHGLPIDERPIFCVGEKTRAYVATRTTAPLFSPAEHRAEALVECIEAAFGAELHGKRFLFPRAPEGREVIAEALAERGAIVEAIAVYRIAAAPPPAEAERVRLDRADVFTFASGETLRAFLEQVAGARALLEQKQVAVIGPVAAEKARALGVRVDITPKTATLEALVEAIAAQLV